MTQAPSNKPQYSIKFVHPNIIITPEVQIPLTVPSKFQKTFVTLAGGDGISFSDPAAFFKSFIDDGFIVIDDTKIMTNKEEWAASNLLINCLEMANVWGGE